MASKEDLQSWLYEALTALGGTATLVEVSKHIWHHHEGELRGSGDLFYTWQYDVRWAAMNLRHSGLMKPVKDSRRGHWELTDRT